MWRRLDRYVAGHFLSSYAVAFFFFVGLFVILDLVNRVDDILETARESGVATSTLASVAVEYYLYYIPTIFLQVSPFLTLIGAIVTVTRLRRSNELIPMVMAGRSVFRILLPVFALALLLTFTMIMVQQSLAPRFADKRAASLAYLKGGSTNQVIDPPPLFDTEGRAWQIHDYHLGQRKIGSVNITWQHEGQDFHIEGKGLIYDRQVPGWKIGSEGKFWTYQDRLDASFKELDFIKGGPTPEQITVKKKSVYELSLTQIGELCRLYPAQLKWKVLLHYHITFPVSNMLLILLGVPFVLRHDNKSFFIGISIALLSCALYFTADFMMRNLGAKGVLDPVWAAWIPVIVFGSAGICLFDSIRT